MKYSKIILILPLLVSCLPLIPSDKKEFMTDYCSCYKGIHYYTLVGEDIRFKCINENMIHTIDRKLMLYKSHNLTKCE